MPRAVYVVLLHYPTVNRKGDVVTTAVTNMDIHDIARSSRTFGAKGFYLVTPIQVQKALTDRILSHWREPKSKEYHPDRFEALSIVRTAPDFEVACQEIERECGMRPEVVLTDARPLPNSVSYQEFRKELETQASDRPLAIVFGTGWGVADSFYPVVDRILAPINGPKVIQSGNGLEYNHLSVRAAAAIILDRLFGL